MVVAGVLVWFDEPVDALEACVGSMATLCDRVVAVDGAYEMTPGAQSSSPPEQADAIRAAAAAAGFDCTVVVPETVWIGQVAKRDLALRLAAQGADWVVWADADHRLVGDRDAIRAELAASDADSILHDFVTPPPENPDDLDRLSPHAWHRALAGKTIEHSLLMRALPEMRAEEVHWGYSGIRNGARVSLGRWQTDRYPSGKYARIRSPFHVEHLCFMRDEERLERNRVYSATRDRFRAEHGFEP